MSASDTWFNTFQPQVNHIDPNASYGDDEGGRMYETFGPELEYIQAEAKTRPNHVWTLVEAEDRTYIVPGFHFVNRLGYFVTRLPWAEGQEDILEEDYLDELSPDALKALARAYSDYVIEVCDREDGSVPVCLREFYENDWEGYPMG